jgi:hypothetical protein
MDARRKAKERALSLLHRYVDSLLARERAVPWRAAQVHGQIDEHVRILSTRALVDGSAIVLAELDPASFSSGASLREAPW